MRYLRNLIAWLCVVLIVGVAAIAIPTSTRVAPTSIALVMERREGLNTQISPSNNDRATKHSKKGEVLIVPHAEDDDYDRRRQYWEDRVERRMERREEYLDEENGGGKDDAVAKDSKSGKESKESKNKKGSKASKDDGDDEDSIDQDVERQQDYYERRREYYRDRLDREW